MREGERFGTSRGVRCAFTGVRECGEMCEEDGDRGIDGRCGYSIRRQAKDGLHVARVRAGWKRRE